MTFATDMQQVATELLTEFDERTGDDRMAILKQGDIVWDEVKAEDVIGPDVKYFLTGVERTNLNGLVDGTTIQQGDELITASTRIVDESNNVIDYVPAVKDKILLDGVQWSIVDTPHVNYSGNNLIIAYKMQVRR